MKERVAESKKTFAEIFPTNPDALFVFSADIVPTPGGVKKYKSGSYADLDIRGLLSGGKARVIAAAEAAKHFPNATIVTDTRDRDPKRRRPTHAQVYADELQKFGVSKDRIMLEEKSINTITELVEMVKLAVSQNWHTLAIISNDYQLPRIKEMWTHVRHLADPNDTDFVADLARFTSADGAIVLVSAEDVLITRDPRYAQFIAEMKKTPAYTKRVQTEMQGIVDIQNGSYRKESSQSSS